MKTKKILLLAWGLATITLLFTSCKQQQNLSYGRQVDLGEAPFGEAYEAPCQMYDTDEEFAATGIYRGSAEQKGDVELNALANARQQIWEKFSHEYNGLLRNYRNSYGNNMGNDIQNKLQEAGDQIIKAYLNHIQSKCTKFSRVKADGKVECYVGISVSKAEMASKVAKGVANSLTTTEKNEIDFEEFQFQKEVQKALYGQNQRQ